MHSHDQSTVILQQFNIITQELQNVTNKLSGYLYQITWVCTMAQENTNRLIQDAISQALATPLDSTLTGGNSPRQPRTFTSNWVSNSSNNTNFPPSWQTDDFGVTQHLNWEAYHLQVLQETATIPHTNVNPHRPNPSPFYFNQSVLNYLDIKQNWNIVPKCFHWQMMDAL